MGRSATQTAKSKPSNLEPQPPMVHRRQAKLERRAPLQVPSLSTKKSSRRPQAPKKYQDSLTSSALSTASSDDAPPESPSSHREQQQHQQPPPQLPPTTHASQQMQPTQEATSSRPRRRATNAHFIRFLQTRDPTTQEKVDLKRALQLSLMEYLEETEDSASCSSSDQSNPSSGSSSNNSSTGGGRLDKTNKKSNNKKQPSMGRTKKPTKNNNNNNNKLTNATNNTNRRKAPQPAAAPTRRGASKSSSQKTHQFSNICNCQQLAQQNNNALHQNGLPTTSVCSANTHCCPMSSVLNRYKPVTEKNIYSESDFFHEGIMEYIEYELFMREEKKQKSKGKKVK